MREIITLLTPVTGHALVKQGVKNYQKLMPTKVIKAAF
jgi:hypothetical protein